jgi:hypothetical protein
VKHDTGMSGLTYGSGQAIALAQDPDEHRPERPALLAVDQQRGDGAALRVAPELADPLGAFEVGQHEDVEELGAGSATEGIETLPEPALEFVRPHWRKRTPALGRPEPAPR